MPKRLSVLGAVALAVLAVSALAASAASASSYGSSVEKTDITFSNTTDPELTGTARNHMMTVSGGQIICEMVEVSETVTGTKSGSMFLSSTIKAAPTYTGCTAPFGAAAVVMNGCEYEFQAPKETAANKDWDAEGTKVVCPSGKEIEIRVGSPTVVCTLFVEPQTTTGITTLQNKTEANGKESVTLRAEVTGIKYKSSDPSSICGVGGTSATYNGKGTVRGYKAGTEHANQVNVTIV